MVLKSISTPGDSRPQPWRSERRKVLLLSSEGDDWGSEETEHHTAHTHTYHAYQVNRRGIQTRLCCPGVDLECVSWGGGQLPLMKMTIILLAHANSTTMACSRVQPSSLLWVSVADNVPPCRPGLFSHWKPIVTRWKGLKNRGCKR